MTYANLKIWAVLLATAASALPAAAVQADDAPAEQAQDAEAARAVEARAVLERAAAELAREVLAAQSGPGQARGESDYFKTTGQAEADKFTPADIADALNVQTHPAPAVDAYVKWQFLSAVDGEFPIELGPAVVRAYLDAPRPIPAPGIDPRARPALDQQLQQTAQQLQSGGGDLEQIRRQWDEYVASATAGNDLILAYRSALYDKLPKVGPTLAAGLRDAHARAEAGAKASAHFKRVLSDATAWAVGGAAPADVAEIARLLDELAAYEPPQFYDSINPSGPMLKWANRREYLAPKATLAAAANELRRAAQNAATNGGLRLKEP